MGASADVLTVLTQPGAAAAMASVLTAWLTNRKTSVKARLSNGHREIEVSAANVGDAESLVRLLMQPEGERE